MERSKLFSIVVFVLVTSGMLAVSPLILFMGTMTQDSPQIPSILSNTIIFLLYGFPVIVLSSAAWGLARYKLTKSFKTSYMVMTSYFLSLVFAIGVSRFFT